MGDALLSEPRDPDGPPEEVFNCRCSKEEFLLSQLPAELLPQVEGRLTDAQLRFLGVRVVQVGAQFTNPNIKPTPPSRPWISGVPLSARAERILKEILISAGLTAANVSSVTRTPKEQAQEMYTNIINTSVAKQMGLYKAPGKQVIQIYVKNQHKPKAEIIRLMTQEINNIGPINVSKHLDPSVYAFDVRPFSILNKTAFVKAAKAHPEVLKIITPTSGDPAYHIEISP